MSLRSFRPTKGLERGSAMTHKSGATMRRPTLGDEERRHLGRALGALGPFRALRATMPLQYVTTFLLVALNEGRGVTEYAEMAGVSQSVMSRHLLDIGERDRYMEKGFGLITYRPNPFELRKHEVFLTDKGRALAHEIVRQMSL
jgi:DNA-binding MarR family transcriptional regulator